MSCHPRSLISEFMMILDFFNDAVYLNLNGRRNLATAMGGLLSVGLVAILAYQGISQSVEMYGRDSSTIYQIMEFESEPSSMLLNRTNNFFFAITTSVNDIDSNMTESSLFSFTATFNQYYRLKDGTREKLKSRIHMAPCNSSDFPESVFGKGSFTLNALQYGYCPTGIDFTDTEDGTCPSVVKAAYPNCLTPPNFNLEGGYLSQKFEFIQFNLSICNQSDPHLPFNVKCASGNITQAILDKAPEINLFYTNTMVNPVFYETPNKTLIDTMYWNLNPEIYKIADIYLDRVLVQDYDSYLFATTYSNRSFYSVQSDKLREMQIVRFEAGLPLLQWNLRRSTLNSVTTRTYSKIQDVMTNLGGFSSNLIFVAALIALGYVRYKYQMILSNELYDFQNLKGKQHELLNGKKKTMVEMSGVNKDEPTRKSSGNNELMPPDQVENSTKVVKSYFEMHLNKRKKINHNEITYAVSILGCCCRKGGDQKLGETARNLVLEDLDIIKVINKVKEVDKLKLLLLNRYQREAFNFIEKPLLTVEGDKTIYKNSIMMAEIRERESSKGVNNANEALQKLIREREEDEPILKYARLYMTYRTLKEDKNPANEKYNKKLIDLIDFDLIKVFKVVDQKIGDDPNPHKFEMIVKKMLEEHPGSNAGME